MVTKLLSALQGTIQRHPDTVQRGISTVRNGVNWLNSQPFGSEVKNFVRQLSFTVNLGSFPEFNTRNFTITKNAGDFNLYGATERNGRFTMTVDGFMRSARRAVTVKQTVATERVAEAKRRADEAQRLAAEAARLATEAQAAADAATQDANTFSSVVGAVGSGSRW